MAYNLKIVDGVQCWISDNPQQDDVELCRQDYIMEVAETLSWDLKIGAAPYTNLRAYADQVNQEQGFHVDVQSFNEAGDYIGDREEAAARLTSVELSLACESALSSFEEERISIYLNLSPALQLTLSRAGNGELNQGIGDAYRVALDAKLLDKASFVSSDVENYEITLAVPMIQVTLARCIWYDLLRIGNGHLETGIYRLHLLSAGIKHQQEQFAAS